MKAFLRRLLPKRFRKEWAAAPAQAAMFFAARGHEKSPCGVSGRGWERCETGAYLSESCKAFSGSSSAGALPEPLPCSM